MPELSPAKRLPGADRAGPERAFWLALTAAALLHAVLIVGFNRSPQRQMGERNGSPEAVNVSLVDPADLPGGSGVASKAGSAPAESAAAPPAPQPAANARPAEAQPLEEQSDLKLPIDSKMLGSFTLPEPAGGQGRAADQPKDKSSSRRQLDLSMPWSPGAELFSAGGWSGSATRPPDITRSGENDEFGRRVIRALHQTMPEMRGVVGRVTVRLLLSEAGNLAQVELIRSSGDSALDQSVVFSVQQASFPFPPAKATRSDLTFLVTYIYR